MRISDWSSDVCSSDLHVRQIYHAHLSRLAGQFEVHAGGVGNLDLDLAVVEMPFAYALAKALARRLAGALAGQGVEQPFHRRLFGRGANQIGRASCRERVCKYV